MAAFITLSSRADYLKKYTSEENSKPTLNKTDYLKKYVSGTESTRKKKRRKKVSKTHLGCKIIDDDIDIKPTVSRTTGASDHSESEEEVPFVVSVEDDASHKVKFDSAQWKVIGDEAGIKSPSRRYDSSDSDQSLPITLNASGKTDKTVAYRNQTRTKETYQSNIQDSNSEKLFLETSKKRHDSDSDPSLPRKQKKRHDSDSDHSLQRGSKQRHDSDSDQSLPRSSKHRKGSDSDQSLPRTTQKSKNSKSDQSPPRTSRKSKGSDSDQSLPRASKKYDQPHKESSRRERTSGSSQSLPHPSRKDQVSRSNALRPHSSKTKNRHDSGSDMSPPRKRHDSGSDMSPPRKRHDSGSDMSPPRKRQDPGSDLSPPRQGNSSRSHSQSRTSNNRFQKDRSLPRLSETHKKNVKESSKVGHEDRQSSVNSSQNSRRARSPEKIEDDLHSKERPVKTLSGLKAGLQTAKVLRTELKYAKTREQDHLKNISDDVLGRGAQTVFRERSTGKLRDLKEENRQEQMKKAKENEMKAQYALWGKGLAQKDDQVKQAQEDLHEMTKPLARYKDDEDLDRHLKEQERLGDPMLQFMRKKKALGVPSRPTYKGPPPPPNRFNLMPGYRWDGVDRSNGFEKKVFDKQASKVAVEEEAYRWSTENM